MSHPLHRQVRVVGRRARALLLMHGLCWFLATTLAAAIALGIADYAIRYRDLGVRVISSVAFAAISTVAFVRFIWPTLRRRFDDVEIAQRIERCYPQLGDTLSSTVAFLRQQPRADLTSSAGLRQAVIADANALSRNLNLFACLDARIATRSLLLVGPVLLLIGAFWAVDRDAAARVTRRLLAPWSHEDWPRWNALQFVTAPRSIAAGDDFEVQLIDRHGHLPKDAVLQYWFAGDEEDEIETRPLQPRDGMLWQRRENVLRPFRYRALGGDDDTMEWHELDVVAPVRVENLVIWQQPPAYARIANSQINGGPIRVLAGTSLSISGRADRPLKAARLQVDIGGQVTSHQATLVSSGQEFSLTEIVAEREGAGHYWLELTDEDGLLSRQEARAAWQVVLDQPPALSLQKPEPESACLPTATVPLHVAAWDDLDVQRVELRSGEQTTTIFERQPDASLRPTLSTTTTRHEFEFDWDLRPLGLQPLDVVNFELRAFDFRGQASEPQPGSVRIMTDEDFDGWLQRQQALLAQRLNEALRILTAAQGQVASVAIQVTESGALSTSDVDLLQSVEMQQRQIERLLIGEEEGASRLAADLVAALQDNQLDRPDVLRRASETVTVLDALREEQLATLSGSLTSALKVARLDPADKDSLRPALAEINGQQEALRTVLERLVDLFAAWEDYRHHIQGFTSLLREQQELATRTNELSTLGKPLGDLSADERARLQRLALQQAELARRFERDFAALEALQQRLAESNSSEAETLARATQAARAAQLNQRLQEAQANLSQNQLGNATRAQQDAIEQLGTLLDALNNRDTQRNSRQWNDLLITVQGLVEHQAALNDDTRSAAEIPVATDREALASQLATRQQQLAETAHQPLESQSASGAFALGLSTVERLMRQAGDQLEHGELGTDTQQVQMEAGQRLQSMLKVLQAGPNQKPPAAAENGSQADAASAPHPPSSASRPSLVELHLVRELQLHIQRRTEELEQLRQPDGELDAARLAELNQLAAEQESLSELLSSWIPAAVKEVVPQKSGESVDSELDAALERAGVPGFRGD